MVAASFVFYAAWNTHYALLLAGSIVGNQVLANVIHRAEDERARRGRLVVASWPTSRCSVGSSTPGSSPTRRHGLGVDRDPLAAAGPELLLPIGISFFTFQALSYVIDVSRSSGSPGLVPRLRCLPVVLPPSRGRADRAGVGVPPAAPPARTTPAGSTPGSRSGSSRGPVQEGRGRRAISRRPRTASSTSHCSTAASTRSIGVYAYALQIYADFSGYTDMAIGLALLLGFRFPANFDAPYTATSLQDFWRRWHITLSRWLRDYVYVGLGGNRGGKAAHVPQHHDHDAARRPVARRGVDVRVLGCAARRWSRASSGGGATGGQCREPATATAHRRSGDARARRRQSPGPPEFEIHGAARDQRVAASGFGGSSPSTSCASRGSSSARQPSIDAFTVIGRVPVPPRRRSRPPGRRRHRLDAGVAVRPDRHRVEAAGVDLALERERAGWRARWRVLIVDRRARPNRYRPVHLLPVLTMQTTAARRRPPSGNSNEHDRLRTPPSPVWCPGRTCGPDRRCSALVLASLFCADSLERVAERQPFGTTRDVGSTSPSRCIP